MYVVWTKITHKIAQVFEEYKSIQYLYWLYICVWNHLCWETFLSDIHPKLIFTVIHSVVRDYISPTPLAVSEDN